MWTSRYDSEGAARCDARFLVKKSTFNDSLEGRIKRQQRMRRDFAAPIERGRSDFSGCDGGRRRPSKSSHLICCLWSSSTFAWFVVSSSAGLDRGRPDLINSRPQPPLLLLRSEDCGLPVDTLLSSVLTHCCAPLKTLAAICLAPPIPARPLLPGQNCAGRCCPTTPRGC